MDLPCKTFEPVLTAATMKTPTKIVVKCDKSLGRRGLFQTVTALMRIDSLVWSVNKSDWNN